MNNYRHAMVMVENVDDGAALLSCVAPLALDPQSPTEITLSHFSEDYRAMNYISDSMMDDAVAEDVIKAKAMLSHLVKISPFPIKTLQLVTLRQFDEVYRRSENRSGDCRPPQSPVWYFHIPRIRPY